MCFKIALTDWFEIEFKIYVAQWVKKTIPSSHIWHIQHTSSHTKSMMIFRQTASTSLSTDCQEWNNFWIFDKLNATRLKMQDFTPIWCLLIRAGSALQMQFRSVPASGAIPAPICAAKTKETTFAPTPFAQLTPPAVVFIETERDKVKDAQKNLSKCQMPFRPKSTECCSQSSSRVP